MGDLGLMDERAGRVRRAGKAAIESLADNLFDDLLRFLPFGNVTRLIARAVNAATMAYLLDETNKSPGDISKALAAREVETIFTQRLADRSDFPEPSKAKMRKAIVSEFDKLIDELEVTDKEKAKQEKEMKIAELTIELEKKLRGGEFEPAHRLANTILELDPANPEATRAEKFTILRVDDTDSFWGRSAAVWLLLLTFLGIGRFFARCLYLQESQD